MWTLLACSADRCGDCDKRSPGVGGACAVYSFCFKLHLALTPVEISFEICCSTSADTTVIFEVWKGIFSMCNILGSDSVCSVKSGMICVYLTGFQADAYMRM